jgi:hypothetical protein
MIKIGKRTKKTETETKAETPVVETVTHDEVGQMAQEIINDQPMVEEPKAEEPKAETPAEEPKAKAKKQRYASVDLLGNDNAIISWVKRPNPKIAGKKSAVRYDRYYREGMTVGEYCDAYKANNEPRMLARNDLRWDYQHGFITIEEPAVAETSVATEPPAAE